MPYEFTTEAFSKFSEDIINAKGDQATLTTILADMQGTVTDAVAKSVSDTEKVQQITAENERLLQANMNLFLRVGEQQKPDSIQRKTDDEEKPQNTADYMSNYFANLDKK